MGKYYIKNKKKGKTQTIVEYTLKKYDYMIESLKQKIANLSNKEEENNDNNQEKLSQYEYLQISLEMKKEAYLNKLLRFRALKRSYMMSNDKRILELANDLNEVIDFFVRNTNLSEEEIQRTIDDRLFEVIIKNEFEENPTGIGYYDYSLGTLGIREDIIHSSEIKEFLQHEFTHVLGSNFVNDIIVNGYERLKNDDYLQLRVLKKQLHELQKYECNRFNIKILLIKYRLKKLKRLKKYEQFNESIVDWFACKENENKVYDMKDCLDLDVRIFTKTSETCLYTINGCIVNQMMIANGVEEDELFKGLYDYETSERVKSKFDNNIYEKLTTNIEKNAELLREYVGIRDNIYEKYGSINEDNKYSKEEVKNKNRLKKEIKNLISKSERMIIDKIIVKRLKKMNEKEKQELLEKYSKYIITEIDYLKKQTGFKEEPLVYKNNYVEENSEIYTENISEKCKIESTLAKPMEYIPTSKNNINNVIPKMPNGKIKNFEIEFE